MPGRQAASVGQDGDALDYQMALEDVYGVVVVVELAPAKVRMHYGWSITAKAYQMTPDASRRLQSFAICLYPTVAHKTFQGAIMGALFGLEDRLRAYTTLQLMGDTP